MQWKEEEPKCPACGAAAEAKTLECAACGVVFEKWRKKMARELPPSDRSLDAPPPVLVRETDGTQALAFRAAGSALLFAAAFLTGWLYWGGLSGALVAGAVPDREHGYSISAPSGWRDTPENDCGGPWGACMTRYIDRGEPAKDRFLERLTVRVIPRGPQALGLGGRAELERKLRDEILSGMSDGALAPVSSAVLDGVAGFRLEGRGSKHFKVETSPAVVTNAQAALAEQKRLNPGRSVYTVWAAQNPWNRDNGTVTLKAAEYVEFHARPVLGRIVVPMRSSLLLLSYQYDEADEAAFTSELGKILASFRVLKRARPMDGLPNGDGFLALGAAAGLAILGMKLLRA